MSNFYSLKNSCHNEQNIQFKFEEHPFLGKRTYTSKKKKTYIFSSSKRTWVIKKKEHIIEEDTNKIKEHIFQMK